MNEVKEGKTLRSVTHLKSSMKIKEGPTEYVMWDTKRGHELERSYDRRVVSVNV